MAVAESPALRNFYSGRFEEDARWLAVRDGIYGAELLAVAVAAFRVLPLIERPLTVGAIRNALNLAERPVEVMLSCLAAMRIIDRDGDKAWIAESSGEVLNQYSQWLRGPFDERRPVYHSILQSMLTDSPSGWSASQRPWLEMMEGPLFATRFTATMNSRGRYLGKALASRVPLRGFGGLLDIAGGSGVYSCFIAEAYSKIEGLVLEKQPVDAVAREMIEDFGYSARIGVEVADIHADPLPTGFDVHLWSNVFHDWNESTVSKLLKRSYESLASGGLLIIHDIHTNRERTGPLPTALRSVFFMVATEGMCHSLAFLESALVETGFTEIEIVPSIMDYSIILAGKPRRDREAIASRHLGAP